MLENCDIRIFLLILSLLTNIKSTKVLSDQKKCGDPECETSMSRALTIKDYSGPDCRYLNFKAGEEITIYFKLSRKREDLWAGSKGRDFGYFPMDAVQIEEVFITKEVEVPTKETDFLCLDGKEYVFENEGSILNHDEGNEYLHLHTDVFPKEYKETFPDIEEFDSKSKKLYILESTSHDDSELRDSKIGQDETIQQEDQNSQTLEHIPSQSSWTISGFADWFGLERKENEEAAGKIADTAKEVTFRHRKTAIMDDSDLKTLNEEGDIEPRTSSWFKSTFTDLLHYGSEKSGLGFLYKENDPEILDSSTTAGTIERDTTAVSEEEHRNSGQSKANWFDIELSDVLTFGYSKENKGKEKPTGGEESDQNEESPPPSTQTSLIQEDLRKQNVEIINSEEQEKYYETIKQIVASTLQKEQEKYDQEAPEKYINKANKHIDLEAAAPSFSTEVLDKIVKYAEQDSESRNQVMENINVKAVMKESDRTNDQSGWYESLYSSFVNVKRVTADNQPGHKSVGIKSTHESAADQLQGIAPLYIQNARGEKHEDPPKHQPFLSISYFTNVLNFQGLASKENTNAPDVEKELKSSKESGQSKNSDEIVDIDKESKLVLNQNIIEKVSENKHVDTSQENIVASSSAAKSKEGNREKTEDGKLGEYKTHLLSVKYELEHRLSNGQCIQIHWNRTSESLEIQNNSNTKDKNISHIWEVEQPSPLQLENLISSPGIYSSERSMLVKEEQYGGEAVQHNNEYIKNLRLEDTEMYLDKKSNGETRRNDEVESSLVTNKNTFFRELKEQSDNFAQSRKIQGEGKILLDVSDEDKLLINGEKEPILTEKTKEMGSEVKEVSREPDSKSSYIDCNEHASADQTNKKAQEKGASPNDWNIAQFPFSSHSSQDTDFSDPTNSEEKPSQLEQLQPFFSLSHYKLLLGSQSFMAKSKNYLQEEDKSSKNENSQAKSSVEILMRNKEIKEKNQLYPKMKGETNMKIDFSNQDILLPSSAMQDNGDSENVIEEAQLLTDTSSASTEKYLLDHTMDSLFKNQNLKEKDTKDKECTNIKGNNQSFSGEQHDTPELKVNVQKSSQQYKIMKNDFTSNNPNCNYDKWLVSLQKDYVTDSYENRELAEMKIIESMSSDAIKDDFPLCLNYYKSVITSEGMNHFSQERAKRKTYISEHLTENYEDKQYGKEDTENESNKPTNEEHSDILNQQGFSTEATSQGLFQSEKKTDGLASQIVSYNSVNVKKKNVQDPQMQTDEKVIEEKYGSVTHKYVDNGQHSDSSITTKVVYNHGTQGQMTSSSNSGIFPKENMHSLQGTIGLTYQKEDGNELKNEQVVTSSYLAPQDAESSNIIGLEPDEKFIKQVICNTKIHSTPGKEVEKLKILGQHKQIDGMQNNEGTTSEHQKEILDTMPKLPGVTAQKKNEDILLTIDNGSLLQKHSVAESISSENPPLNLEVQSDTFETDNNVNPSKLFSHDIPHHIEAVDYKKDYMPPHKDNLDIYHLATDPDDETLAHKIISLLPKNLKYVEKQRYSEYVRDSQEKGQKVTENDKETEHSGRSEKPERQGVVSNIFGKTSWLFGDLFQSKPRDVTKNKDDGNIIVTQTKTDRQEADVVGRDFEQGKSNLQSTKAIHYSHNFNIIEQESKGEIYSHTKEKSITDDFKNDNQKEAVSQETVQNGKGITDTELDLKEASFFMGFQEAYIKLVVESKRILQATVCERHELESLEQECEKVYHEITTFPCENIDSNQRRLTTSQEDGHKLNFVHKKCLKAKSNLLRELQSLVVDIKNNCARKRAKSGIISKEQLPDNAAKESNYLNSDKEPNNSQHSETNTIPPVNNEVKMHASIKSDERHPDFKGKLPGDVRMTQDTFISNEREWLFQIILLLNDFCALITSGLSLMTTASKKICQGRIPFLFGNKHYRSSYYLDQELTKKLQ